MTSEFWKLLWPAMTAVGATWVILERAVIGPLQATERRLEVHLAQNDTRIERLTTVQSAVDEWRKARQDEMIILRADLEQAFNDREKKLDRLNARLDAIEQAEKK